VDNLETPRNPSQFLVKTLVEKVFEKKDTAGL
jgi:hypothetical protein